MGCVVLGCDPGIANCGLAIMSLGRSRHIACWTVNLVKSTPKVPQSERLLLSIYEAAFTACYETLTATLVSVEQCFHGKNVSSAQSTECGARRCDVCSSAMHACACGQRNNSPTVFKCLYWDGRTLR